MNAKKSAPLSQQLKDAVGPDDTEIMVQSGKDFFKSVAGTRHHHREVRTYNTLRLINCKVGFSGEEGGMIWLSYSFCGKNKRKNVF